jgi:hypothetical protein
MVIYQILSNILETVSTKAYAATAGVGYSASSAGDSLVSGQTVITYWGYVGTIYSFALVAGSSLAGLIMFYAGILYMTSKGESSKIQSAKEYFLGALIGLAILIVLGPLLKGLGLPDIDGTYK